MINTWNESLLHEELKNRYCAEGGATEVPLEGSICDAVLADGSIVEIQTAHLGKLRAKLEKLLAGHRVTLVYPVARNTMIETYATDGSLKSRRKSPRHGTVYQLFDELTAITHLLNNDRFAIEVVHADVLETRIADGTGSWRRKGVRKDERKLACIHEHVRFSGLADYAGLVPAGLDEEFTVAELALHGAGRHAGKMAWVLRKCGVLELAGKRGRAYLYRRMSVD